MRANQYKRLLDSVKQLTDEQLEGLYAEVAYRRLQTDSLRALEEAKPIHQCLWCKGKHVVKNGYNRGLQRYRCQDCHKTFNAASGTPLSLLRNKELFLRQAECMAQSMSVRATAEQLGVSRSTAFRWRHRFLCEVVGHQPKQVVGLLEADETYLLESQKGSRHLTRMSRTAY